MFCLHTNCGSIPSVVINRSREMSGQDLISEQGLRLDGRRANELRRIQCKLGVFSQPDGSAYLEQGNTKVLAAVYGPHQVSFFALKS